MTTEQFMELERRLTGVGELHHGDCVGADKEAHDLAKLKFGIWTIAHPPLNTKLRAWCEADEVREPDEYLVRDRHIVDDTDELIATPATFSEVARSGTWATVRYAKLMGKPVTMIYPDGEVQQC
jgi:hypothetical protein